MTDIIERLQAEIETLKGVDAEIAILRAKVAALEADAKRYQHLRTHTSAESNGTGRQVFVLPYISPAGHDLMRGSVAQHLDKCIDAAMKDKP